MNDRRLQAYLLVIVFLLAVNAILAFIETTSASGTPEVVPVATIAVGGAAVVTIATLFVAIVFVPSRD